MKVYYLDPQTIKRASFWRDTARDQLRNCGVNLLTRFERTKNDSFTQMSRHNLRIRHELIV